MMACPACDVAPLARLNSSKSGIASEELQLSLPTVHCAACISKVERALNSHDAVQDARVNLTLKRALVKLSSPVEIENIIRVVNGVGYEAFELDAAMLAGEATDQVGRALLMRLGVAGFAMMNVMLLSVAVWSGATEATRDMFHWISAAIALPTVAFSGQPFYRNAWSAVSKAQLNMDVPISLAILLAAGMSVYETANSGEHAYFDAALSLTFFLLAGRYLDHRTRRLSRSA
ncbi:MAG: heavy metal translocating P-type ATPase, partial [Paracoccaceae bacterium]|nr:heavy metal translocating P-type ATPase [Paracoccaceae bacterium]